MERMGVMRLVIVIAVLAISCTPGLAQNRRDALENLRSDLRKDRKALIAEQMNLNEKESEGFWPVYRDYRIDVEKGTDEIVKLILEYDDAYPRLTDDQAEDMLSKYFKMESELLSVKRKYTKKFGKVLPATKVFRFMQLDNRLDLGVRTGLAASIPLLNR